MTRSCFLSRPLTGIHPALASTIRPGDTVIDATMGNGNDTLFLAKCVGSTGKVFAFDIQPQALIATEKRLKKIGISTQNIELILASHTQLEHYVTQPINAVMFNLGYLPGSNHACITQGKESLSAIQASMRLLEKGGVISIACYTGHQGGKEEALLITEYLRTLDIKQWLITHIHQLNGGEKAPFLLLLEKSH